jgi:hypothetical protein
MASAEWDTLKRGLVTSLCLICHPVTFTFHFGGDEKREALSTDVGHDDLLKARTFLSPDMLARARHSLLW